MAAELDDGTLLNSILEGIGQPFYAVDRDWRFYLYNADAERHFGRPASEMLGRVLWDVFSFDINHERGRILRDAMARREIVKGETLSMVGRYVSYCMFPLGDGLGVVFRDVTDRRQAEALRDRAEEALRKRSTELEAVLETIPTAVWFTYDRDVQTLVGNRRAAELVHMPPGPSATLTAPPDKRPPFRFYRQGKEMPGDTLPLQRAAHGEEVKDELVELRLADGSRRTLLMRASPLRDPSGEVQGAVCAAADVTERLRYEDHLKLLLNELNHRVKNTLSIVQSIATLTLKGADSGAREDFEQRLLTLSAVHNLLTDENWDGALLRDVVRASLKALPDGRIAIEGEELRLRPKSAVTLSMALHELATNAVKYGALSTEQGRVAVRWRVSGERFLMSWRESGGPRVAPPERTGFGTRMIRHGLAAELRGTVEIDYRPEGVVCTVDAPLKTIHDESARA
ncbi:MAG TPA: PAS domain-containing protein [Reyranella sp.]|nr:PAS domain-containing protein [Reyranella sp.]